MKITLTSMSGNTRNIQLQSKEEVLDFIDLFKSTLQPNQRMKVTCDLLGIDGYLQGSSIQIFVGTSISIKWITITIQHNRKVLTIFFVFVVYYPVSFIKPILSESCETKI